MIFPFRQYRPLTCRQVLGLMMVVMKALFVVLGLSNTGDFGSVSMSEPVSSLSSIKSITSSEKSPSIETITRPENTGDVHDAPLDFIDNEIQLEVSSGDSVSKDGPPLAKDDNDDTGSDMDTEPKSPVLDLSLIHI